MKRALRWNRVLLMALALAGSCGKDKATGLDVRLYVTGAMDQVRIDEITLDDDPVSLTGEQTLFPMSPMGMLKNGDILTIWFRDNSDGKTVFVKATGLLCGRVATEQATSVVQILTKGQTYQTSLSLFNFDGITCADAGADGTGAGGRGGGGGSAGGAGGSASSAGAGGVAGSGATGGASGSAGVTGNAGRGGSAGSAGTTGSAGTGGSAGRGGGTAGTGGAAGRGGTGGTGGSAGAGGAAARGGTGGTAGTGGAAGRGGSGGAAGRGGTGGTAGTGGSPSTCSTAAVNATAQPGPSLPPQGVTNCGYPLLPGGASVQYIWTTNPVGWAFINPTFSPNGVACGRCAELTRTLGTNVMQTVVTVVGTCADQACMSYTTQPLFQLSPAAYNVLSPFGEPSIPAQTGDILTMRYVECPVPNNPQGQPEKIRANIGVSGGVASSVVFVGHRFGIASASVTTTSGQLSMSRNANSNGYWIPPGGANFGTTAIVQFRLADTDGHQVVFDYDVSNPQPYNETIAQFPPCGN